MEAPPNPAAPAGKHGKQLSDDALRIIDILDRNFNARVAACETRGDEGTVKELLLLKAEIKREVLKSV